MHTWSEVTKDMDTQGCAERGQLGQLILRAQLMPTTQTKHIYNLSIKSPPECRQCFAVSDGSRPF